MQGPTKMQSKTMSVMTAAVLFLPAIAHTQPARTPARTGHPIIAPEHLQRNRPYGTSTPSTMAQARSDVAADRAARQYEPKIRMKLRQVGEVGPDVALSQHEIARIIEGPAYVKYEQAARLSGWTFAVLTMRTLGGLGSTVKREPYGVFNSQDACDIARAKKIVELDQSNLRQPHLAQNSPFTIRSDLAGGGSGQQNSTTQLNGNLNAQQLSGNLNGQQSDNLNVQSSGKSTTTTSGGASSGIETMNVSECAADAEKLPTGSQMAQKH
jgi:hypothetical protein